MKRSSKPAAIGLAAASALALSAGIGSASSPRKIVVADPNAKVEYSGTLSILTKFGQQQLAPYFVDLGHEYEKLHPGVHVVLDQESDDSVKGKTKTLVASNALPDIYFSWTGNWGENFVRGRRAVDLSRLVGPETPWGKTFSANAVKAFQYGGEYYGIPLYLDGKFMGYSKPMFAKAGVGAPADFAQLLAACDAIRKSGGTPVSLGNKEAWPVVHYAGQLLAYDVPKAVLERDFDPSTAKYVDPGYVQALTQFRQFEQHCLDNSASANGVSYESAIQDLSNLKSAMYYQEILEFDESATPQTPLKVADFGFFQLPAPAAAAGDAKAVEGAPEGYMVSSTSKHIPLAIDFLKFLTSLPHAQVLSAPPYGQPSAVIGGLTAATSSPAVAKGVEQINAASYLMPWLDTANTPGVADAWLASLQALTDGSMTPNQVMGKVRDAAAQEASRRR